MKKEKRERQNGKKEGGKIKGGGMN